MQRRLVPRLARPPPSSLFPYTTLFRSHERLDHERGCDRDRGVVVRPRDRRDSPSVCRWMMDLVRDLLDAQLVDRQDRQIGRVDGVLLEVRDGEPPRVAAMEVGAITLARRLHPALGRWLRRFAIRWL